MNIDIWQFHILVHVVYMRNHVYLSNNIFRIQKGKSAETFNLKENGQIQIIAHKSLLRKLKTERYEPY